TMLRRCLRRTPTACATRRPLISGPSRRSKRHAESSRRGRTLCVALSFRWCTPSPSFREWAANSLRPAPPVGHLFFSSVGVPGFANDILPLTLSGLCERWEEVRILEIINYTTYNQPEVLFETMGFGKPMDHTPLLLTPGTLSFAWGGTVRLLADGLGVDLERIDESYERRPATRPIRIGGYVVEPGTMAALRFEVQGIVGGKQAIVVE